MKNLKISFLIGTLAIIPSVAFAQTVDTSIVGVVNQAIGAAAAQSIMPQAILWLSSFIALQFVLTNFALIKSGADIENVFGKLIGSLAWFSFCFYILKNGPQFIDSVGHGMMDKFMPNVPSPGSIITSTMGLCAVVLAAIAFVGTSIVGTGNSAVANVLVGFLFIIASIGLYMAVKIMLISLELGLVIMLSPLSFSFLGLNALKDQGIAPLKSLISLVYRMILLGIICSAFTEVSNAAQIQFQAINWANPTTWGDNLKAIFALICAYPVIGFLAYKSDSIASSLASGSTSMGPGDVASAAAAGAAAGAAIGAGSGAVVGAAAKGPQAMGDVIKGMMSGGSVSNASSRGAGGQAPAGDAPRRGAALSTQGAGQGAGSSAGAGSTSGGASSVGVTGTATQGGVGTSRASQDSGGAPVRSSAGADGTAPGAPSQESKGPDQSAGQDLAITPAAESTVGSASENPISVVGGASMRPSVSALGAAPVRSAPAAGSLALGATANSRSAGATSGSDQGRSAAKDSAASTGQNSAAADSVAGAQVPAVSGESGAPSRSPSNTGNPASGAAAGNPVPSSGADTGVPSPTRSTPGPMTGAAGSVGSADSAAGLNAGDAPLRSTNGNSDAATSSALSGTTGAQALSGPQNEMGSSTSAGEPPARSAAPPAEKSDARSLGDGSSASLNNPAGGTTEAPKADPKPRSRREHLDELTRHLSQEKAATSVSISTHNSD